MKVMRLFLLIGIICCVLSLKASSFGDKIRAYPEVLRVFRALWGDDVESKIDVIDTNVASNLTTEGTINIKVTELSPTALTTSLISSGTITLDTAGNYALAEDIVAGIDISTSKVALDLNHRCVTGVITVDGGGSDIVDIRISNGLMRPAAPSTGPAAAITVSSDVSRVEVEEIMIVCDDTTADGIAGRSCIEISGDFVTVSDCYLVSGAGGDSSSGNGGAGGDGIELTSTSTYATVKNNFIITGNGGASTPATGGRGGHGVYVNGASLAMIHDCIVNLTGNGGAGSGASDGDGGDGINITSTSTEIEVRNCILRNTGTSTGGGGTNGKAINDFVPAADPGKSIIWSNIATSIGNTTNRYQIGNSVAGAAGGVDLVYPTTTDAVNTYANVYVTI